MSTNTSEDTVTSFRFASKAMTLERLSGRVTKGVLCDQVIVRAAGWTNGREDVVARITDRFGDGPLIVRSSAAAEDGWESSLAGVHLSVTDVEPVARDIAKAIDEVFASYVSSSADDEVLVQPMVDSVAVSGVVLTRDLDTGSPYFVISYDDLTGRTDTVTGGKESKTVLVHRARPDALRSARLRKLVDCVAELEAITGVQELDVEFCITDAEQVYILQVRPLSVKRQWTALPDGAVDGAIDGIREEIKERMTPAPGIAGRTTILSEMTDWNPAEMIGTKPRPLALSLYTSLITDRVWAEARARMGYRHVDAPLLVDFRGRPYIDVRLSLNSFLPAGIDDSVAGPLVDHQLGRLAENRDLHDKVEFEIAATCRDLAFDRVRARLVEAGLGRAAIEDFETALGAVTRTLLEAGLAGIADLVGTANRLLEARPELAANAPLERVRRLLDDCRTLGTLPFSQLARHGFMGVQFLRSLVQRGVLGDDDNARFMHSVHTVATDLAHDMHGVVTGAKPEQDFFARYGHLRPGTYDIASWRYDERPDLFLGHSGLEPPAPAPPFALSARQRAATEKLLNEHGYRLSADELLDYITAAVKAREQAKFAFSRAISDALSGLVEWGETVGLTRDALSFLPIEAIVDGGDIDALKDLIDKGRDDYALTAAIRLPHLICEPADIDVVRLPVGKPTFITDRSVTGRGRRLGLVADPDIDGHIVLIESADPGFDWIFSHAIQGLVTKYGGANSHMAIRCAEFGLPAAIGCGERLFDSLVKASVIELNCAAQKVSGH